MSARGRLESMKKACFGKIQHKSMLAAQYYLDNLGHRDKANLNIYKCPYCHFYHLGHNKKKKDV